MNSHTLFIRRTEAEKQALEGRQSAVRVVAAATNRSAAALYKAIHRKEIRAVWVGRTPMIPPAETLRLLGIDAHQEAVAA